MPRRKRDGDFAQAARRVVVEATEERDDASLADEREAERLRGDPATRDWLADAHESLRDGRFDARVRDQLTPSELVEKLKARR